MFTSETLGWWSLENKSRFKTNEEKENIINQCKDILYSIEMIMLL